MQECWVHRVAQSERKKAGFVGVLEEIASAGVEVGCLATDG